MRCLSGDVWNAGSFFVFAVERLEEITESDTALLEAAGEVGQFVGILCVLGVVVTLGHINVIYKELM